MKTNTQKIVEEWHKKEEKEKQKVKEISYYKKIILKKDKEIIKKIYKVLEIIEEEMTLFSDYERYDIPFGSIIDKNKLSENKILISDFKKIINLLRSSKFIVIPKDDEWPSDNKTEKKEKEIFVLFPRNDSCEEIEETEEEYFGYPYGQNFENLNKAIKEIMCSNENLKTNNHNMVFNKNTGILKIGNKSLEFRKFTNQHYLLEVIFENRESRDKDWQFSEISEDNNSPLGGFSDKKFHNIANAIKHKITEKTGIEKFFITTTHSIKINKKCFKKS